jgi:hypothetical protein
MIDLIALLPDNEVRRVVCYCLNERGMTLETTERVLYDATKMVGAMNTLLGHYRVFSASRISRRT